MDDRFNYSRLVDQTLHIIVYKVLKQVQEEGLPGDHHFFIAFDTTHKGVLISDELRKEYPEEMTIVLQYQFENLSVTRRGFSVTLSFDGRKDSVYVPFGAIISFADPSVEFGLQFREGEGGHNDDDEVMVDLLDEEGLEEEMRDFLDREEIDEDKSDIVKEARDRSDEKIISIDKFRKK